jgi:hypothetical protein
MKWPVNEVGLVIPQKEFRGLNLTSIPGILEAYQPLTTRFQAAGGYHEHVYHPTDAVFAARERSLAGR